MERDLGGGSDEGEGGGGEWKKEGLGQAEM